jgi:hypothetical protein
MTVVASWKIEFVRVGKGACGGRGFLADSSVLEPVLEARTYRGFLLAITDHYLVKLIAPNCAGNYGLHLIKPVEYRAIDAQPPIRSVHFLL